RFIPRSIAGVALTTVAGCGGGGGGSSLNPPAPPPVELVKISATNAQTVAAGVVRSAIEGGHFASLAVPDAAPGDAFSGKAAPLHSKPSAAREGALVEQSGPVWSQAPVGPM